MRINKLALRKLVLREMHDHMEENDDVHGDRIASFEKGYEFGHDDADHEEEDASDESDETEVDEEGDFDYEDSDVYEETGMIKSNLFMLA